MFERVDLSEDVTLYRGDCLEVLPTLETGSVDLIATDPPYNASVEDSNLVDILKDRRPGKNAGMREYGKWDYGFNPSGVVDELDRVVSSNGQAYVFCSTHLLAEWMFELRNRFDGIRTIVWTKPDPVPSVRQRHWCSADELIVWVWRGRYTFNYLGHNEMYSWQLYQSPKNGIRLHPTQKPIELLKKLVNVSTNAAQVVLDCYMGSGTTGVAAVKLGRKFIGIEIDAGYFEIAVKRISEALAQPRLFPAEAQSAATPEPLRLF